jgi:hypothetical protein
MSDSTLRQVAQLSKLSFPELQERWRSLFGSEPPAYHRRFLVKRLAYRIQELAYGGLSEATRSQMADILQDAGLDEQASIPGRGRTQKRPNDLPLAGTRLVRIWNGDRHEVTTIQGGFEYQGRRYRSLSAIAKAITGTHWNGRAFFGLRGGTPRECEQ